LVQIQPPLPTFARRASVGRFLWNLMDRYYVYVLQSKKNGQLYKGFTKDLIARLKTHETSPSQTDIKMGPFKLMWYCCFQDKYKALAFEKYLKSGSGIAFLKKRLV
jgi:putative endonuclease